MTQSEVPEPIVDRSKTDGDGYHLLSCPDRSICRLRRSVQPVGLNRQT
jgi:hypothetical protein